MNNSVNRKPAAGSASRSIPLLGCPFCGCAPVVEPWHGGGPRKHAVTCDNGECPASPGVTGATKAAAIRTWNTRHPNKALCDLGH